MTSRRATDGGSVLSFTFLDVLMCTMGSLLLLLVVFGVIAKKSTRARRAGEESRIALSALSMETAPPPAAGVAEPADDTAASETPPIDAEQLAKQLEQVRTEQDKLEELRVQAAERRREEQARIAHLEDHERRLEHDLAKLHVTLQALQAAENKQIVDQTQAEREAQRLKDIIRETEAQLAEMRKNAGQKSYAIVPYKGANGTFRRPIYVECTAEAVTIQPEGIRLTLADFDGPLRSGNPLAAAVRAAHEELNARAAAAGQTDMPDPYPLLIVRPEGAEFYSYAVDAIRSWNSEYGYEFLEADLKLKFPEPDPVLARVMAHAVDEARQRQALLAKVAPRRYGPRLGGAGGPGMGGDGEGIGGEGGGFGGYGGDRIGAHASEGAFGGGRGGNGLRSVGGRYGGAGDGNFMDEFEGGSGGPAAGGDVAGGAYNGLGAAGQTAAGAAGNGAPLNGAGPSGGNTPPYGAPPQNGGNSTNGGANAGQYAGAQTGAAGDQAGAGNGAGGAQSANAASGAAGGGGDSAFAGGSGGAGGTGGAAGAAGASAAGGGAAASAGAASGGGLPPMQVGNQRKRSSAADARGANWANAAASRNATAITRPVRVQVTADQLAVLDDRGQPASSGAVSFRQPVDGVMDGLAAAIKQQIDDWGLAGDGMYWRPTLVVSVAPGAERQADRLAELLENSGVDVRLPQATAQAPGGPADGPR